MKTTLALIGKGAWGKNYISTCRLIKNCQLKYVVSRNYKQLYNRRDIDGVIIASPSKTHYKIAKEFTEKGFNILVEKPLAVSLKEVKQLKKLQKVHKNQISVGHVYLYNNEYQKLRRKVHTIGKLHYAEFEGVNQGLVKQNLSALWEWGPHGVALMHDLFGKPEKVKAQAFYLQDKTKPHDLVYINLKYKKVIANIKMGWLMPENRKRLIVVGSKGCLVFDDLKKCKHSKFPLQREVEAFIKSIKTGKPSISDIDHALKVTKILSRAEKSLV